MPNVNRILEQAVLTLRQQIICFNMGSVIIKPVQRIMKYPLILGELIKVSNFFDTRLFNNYNPFDSVRKTVTQTRIV